MIVSGAIRRPRLRRTRQNKPSFVVQPRDHEIVQLVADYRVVSSDIVAALIPGSAQGILRRLQVLYHAGFLDRPRRQQSLGNIPMVYAPGARAERLLGEPIRSSRRDWAEKNRKMGAGYIDHQLMISRFRAMLVLAAPGARIGVDVWRQGPELWDSVVIYRADHVDRVPVAPDAYFVLRLLDEEDGRNRIHCFLEADRSTMTTARYFRKLEGYWRYWRSGRMEARFGVRNALVVTLTRTSYRAMNLAEAALGIDAPEHRGLRMFLFGTEHGLSLAEPAEILEAKWFSPADQRRHSLTE